MKFAPKQIAQGHWGTVFDLGDGRVVKQFREDAEPNSVRFEAEVANLAHKLGVSTPKPLSICDEPQNSFITFEKVEGETLAQHILPRPWKLIWATKKMAGILAKIHAVKIDGPQPIKAALGERIERTKELDTSQKQVALEMLNLLEDGDRLCHMDYHPGNVMVSGASCVVIDWGGATVGSPMADLTYTYVLNKVDGVLEDFPWLNRIAIRAMRGLYVEMFLYFYAKFSGQKYWVIKSQIRKWIMPVAAARLASYGDFETQALLKILRKHGLSFPKRSESL